MADEANSLEDLKTLTSGASAVTSTDEAAVAETVAVEEIVEIVFPDPKIDAQGRSYATGKRKNAIARVWIKPGSGKFMVNGRDQEVYFARPVLRMLLRPRFKLPLPFVSVVHLGDPGVEKVIRLG